MNELGRNQCLNSISKENLSFVFPSGKGCIWLTLRVPTMPYDNPLMWFRHLHGLIPTPMKDLQRRTCHLGFKLSWRRKGRLRDRIIQDSFHTTKGHKEKNYPNASWSQEEPERLWKKFKDEEDPVRKWSSSQASHFNADDSYHKAF